MHRIKGLALGLMFVTGLACADSQPFGRLFTSPEQRSRLDSTRLKTSNQQKTTRMNTGKAPSSTNDESSEAQGVTFSGYVKRGDGQVMVWFNGESELSENKPKEVHSHQFGMESHKVQVRSQGHTKILKPGQIWFVNEDAVKEGFQSDRLSEPEQVISE